MRFCSLPDICFKSFITTVLELKMVEVIKGLLCRVHTRKYLPLTWFVFTKQLHLGKYFSSEDHHLWYHIKIIYLTCILRLHSTTLLSYCTNVYSVNIFSLYYRKYQNNRIKPCLKARFNSKNSRLLRFLYYEKY